MKIRKRTKRKIKIASLAAALAVFFYVTYQMLWIEDPKVKEEQPLHLKRTTDTIPPIWQQI